MWLSTIFDVSKLEKDLQSVKAQLEDPSIFKDMVKVQDLGKKMKVLENKYNLISQLKAKIKNLDEFILMCENENDEGLINEVDIEVDQLAKQVDELFLNSLLSGEYDLNNCMLKIHSGAGGTEACDWVSMLYRMYILYCEKRGFKVKLLDSIDGDGAGFKSITIQVQGENAYGFLKGETGVHRLVRISPFDANKRRHTSFASVEVMPEIEQSTSVEIKDDEIRIDTYRSSGAGGQHVNTTDSAIRITHLPTGIVVSCQNERSQLQNKEMAMKMLIGKLVALKLEENKAKARAIKGDAKRIEWGSQIRSYVFCPYTLVKDLRTDCETSNLDDVMNGNLYDFTIEYLKWNKE